jgi:UDP-3-O-[3-hydroxymyristoyl] N-acetylglucosamine deacetylase/3-hydroxyacyl-[acyl-carrier-protein] dehydratase
VSTILQQRTVASPTKISGRGLFTGQSVTATIYPADPDSGIFFRRSDLRASDPIPAHVDRVVSRPRRTCLQAGEAIVETVEHCLSGLAGLGVDNALIELDGPELPAGDGSAMPFVTAVENAGLVEQDSPRRPLVVSEPVTIREGEAMIAAFPNGGAGLDVLYDLDYGPESVLGRQIHAFTLEPESYAAKIAPARTFSTLADAEKLREAGLFKHLTPKEMLVIGEAGPIDNAFRFEDEPVRHKLLDLIGDLSLVGRPVHGRVVASRSGHHLNQRMARALLDQEREAESALTPAMDIRQIMRLLPHRYPMVLVDRVLELDSDQRAVGVKNVSINEPFFQGHYPGSPIMPGVLIVEAMSQLGGLMLSRKLERTGKIAVLLSLEKVKLRFPVRPGDQLVMETETVRATNRFGEVAARAFVAGTMVAEATIKFMMVDAEQE